MAIGLKLNNGGNITGFSAPVAPDRGFTKETKANIIISKFGDKKSIPAIIIEIRQDLIFHLLRLD